MVLLLISDHTTHFTSIIKHQIITSGKGKTLC